MRRRILSFDNRSATHVRQLMYDGSRRLPVSGRRAGHEIVRSVMVLLAPLGGSGVALYLSRG